MRNLTIKTGETGEALRTILEQIGFEVPQIQPLILEDYPPALPYPRPFNFATFMAYRNESAQIDAIRRAAQAINAERRAAYFAQFTDFADYLSAIFNVSEGYSYKQAAQRLMGYACTRPADPIQFIINGNF